MMKAAPPRGARLAALLCCVVRGCAKKVAISEPLSWAAWLAAQEAHVRAWLAMHATVVLAWVAGHREELRSGQIVLQIV